MDNDSRGAAKSFSFYTKREPIASHVPTESIVTTKSATVLDKEEIGKKNDSARLTHFADSTNHSDADYTGSKNSSVLVDGSGLQLQRTKAEMARKLAKQHKKWNKRFKIFFCCLGYKKNKVSSVIRNFSNAKLTFETYQELAIINR